MSDLEYERPGWRSKYGPLFWGACAATGVWLWRDSSSFATLVQLQGVALVALMLQSPIGYVWKRLFEQRTRDRAQEVGAVWRAHRRELTDRRAAARESRERRSGEPAWQNA